jgi:hypothetical protein
MRNDPRTAPTLERREGDVHPSCDRGALLSRIEVAQREGWDSAPATELLLEVRDHIVRPILLSTGLRGGDAVQAEATGWTTAWQVMAGRLIGTVGSPWGLLWVSVRHAILGEIIEAAYATSARNGWKLRGGDNLPGHLTADGETKRASAAPRLMSLNALAEMGWEPAAKVDHLEDLDVCSGVLDAAVSVLTSVGWAPGVASRVVDRVATHAGDHLSPSRRGRQQAAGWRHLATEIGIPPWQVSGVVHGEEATSLYLC